MNPRLLLLIVALAMAAVFAWRRQSALREIHSEIEQKRLALASGPARSGAASKPLTEAEMAELRKLREEHSELMKLRGSIQELRKLAKQDPTQISAEADARRKEAETLNGWLKHEDESKSVAEAVNAATSFVVEAARIGKRALPSSFAEAESIFLGMAQTNPQPAHMFLQWYNATNNNRFAALEMIPQPNPVLIRDRDHNQDFLIIREKQPRQTPDGKWTRYYGRLQGGIEQVSQPTPSFVTWENAQKAVR